VCQRVDDEVGGAFDGGELGFLQMVEDGAHGGEVSEWGGGRRMGKWGNGGTE
jgi:hypothetical protein